MIKLTYTEQQTELNAKREDTLTRLEWPKITYFLSQFATFDHTKEMLKFLSPWHNETEQHHSCESFFLNKNKDYFLNSTLEMRILKENEAQLFLIPFHLSCFENELKRDALLSGFALVQISTVLKMSSSLLHFEKNRKMEENIFPNLIALFRQLKSNTPLLKTLTLSLNEQGEVLPTASPQLAAAHRSLSEAKQKIRKNLDAILKNSVVKNAVQDSTWMIRDGRYVLPVRTDRKNDVEGIARGVSQTGSTVFIEPKALTLEQAALEKAELEIQIEEYKIIKSLSEQCFAIKEDLFSSLGSLTLIDNIHARAQFANVLEASPCTLMQPNSPTQFYFKNARHPLFILENKASVANNLEINSSHILVLSGPNAGGKTVVLKTVGVFVLMAKCGLCVPSEQASCLEYDNVFVLLGDTQNREENLSTFSGHIQQIKKILFFSNEKTLILLDEGFVGTDPAMGVALARAVLEHLADKKATVIITTHFSSLKTLASEDNRFFNASMEFELKTLRPTYKLLNGIPGQSYALELCERMGLDQHIILQAQKYYGSEAQRMENILQDLQTEKQNVQEELKKQQEISLTLNEELKKIQNEQSILSETQENLVESYKTKLNKRFNAYANRLEIRERQFLKSQEKVLQEIQIRDAGVTLTSPSAQLSSLVNPIDLTRVSIGNKEANKVIKEETPNDNNKLQRNKLSSFEELAQIKIKESSPTLNLTTKIETNFRQPKITTRRSLLDEAQESLDILHKSLDNIDDDLNEELNFVLKLNQESKQKIKQLKPNINSSQSSQKSVLFWKKGLRVKTNKFKEIGSILKEADSKGMIECQFGMLKIKINHSDLMTIEEAANQTCNKKPPIKQNYHPQKNKIKSKNKMNMEIPQILPHKGNSLDLRGLTVDEALSKCELSLDKMINSEQSILVLIHGHGFGKVKEGIRKFLESCSYELSFRPGRHGEGGDGVTVVEFNL